MRRSHSLSVVEVSHSFGIKGGPIVDGQTGLTAPEGVASVLADCITGASREHEYQNCHVTYAKALSVRAVGLHAHHVRIEGAAVQCAEALQKRIRRGEIRHLQRQIR